MAWQLLRRLLPMASSGEDPLHDSALQPQDLPGEDPIQGSTFRQLDLPFEIITMVIENAIDYQLEQQVGDTALTLPTKESRSTVYAMRSVSRAFRDASNPAMGQLIASRELTLTPDELLRFLSILKRNPILACHIKNLSISHRRPVWIVCGLFNHLHHLHQSTSNQVVQGMMDATVMKYTTQYLECEAFNKSGKDVNMLAQIFRLLPNLSDIGLYNNSLFPNRQWVKLEQQILGQVALSTSDDLTLSMFNADLQLLTLRTIQKALNMVEHSLDSLVFCNVITFFNFKDLGTRELFHQSGHTIKTLVMTFKSHGRSTNIFGERGLAQYLSLFPNLEKLELSLLDTGMPFDGLIKECEGKDTLRKLQSIFLEVDKLSSIDLGDFLSRLCSQSLRHATIRSGTLEFISLDRMREKVKLETLVMEFTGPFRVTIYSLLGALFSTHGWPAKRIYVASLDGPFEVWTRRPPGEQTEVLWMPVEKDWSRVISYRT